MKRDLNQPVDSCPWLTSSTANRVYSIQLSNTVNPVLLIVLETMLTSFYNRIICFSLWRSRIGSQNNLSPKSCPVGQSDHHLVSTNGRYITCSVSRGLSKQFLGYHTTNIVALLFMSIVVHCVLNCLHTFIFLPLGLPIYSLLFLGGHPSRHFC